jgi:acyl-CoA dehydrogenase
MDFEYSPKVKDMQARLLAFMDEHIYPNEARFFEEIAANRAKGNAWVPTQIVEELKPKAQAAGLWNLFLPKSTRAPQGLSNLEYAPLCEIMGRVPFAAEIFNCSAPDTGNMETLERYASESLKDEWLEPLLRGEIRSAFLMTEPDVASSDATNIECDIRRDGDHYVINGRKWWSSGAGDPRCAVYIVMGKTNPDAGRHEQQLWCRPTRPASRWCALCRCLATTTRRTATWKWCSKMCASLSKTFCWVKAVALKLPKVAWDQAAFTTACAPSALPSAHSS